MGILTISLLILYISTWKRSDLFLATLCASKLATWRRRLRGTRKNYFVKFDTGNSPLIRDNACIFLFFNIMFEIFSNLMGHYHILLGNLNTQSRSETPPSLARTPGMGFFGSWCMDASTCRQERVGRTYGEGNPVSFMDGTGHMLSNSWTAAAIAYLIVKDSDGSDMDKFLFVAAAYAKGRAKDRNRSNNMLDKAFNSGNFFKGIERNSSLGRGLTHNWNNIRNSHVGLEITKRYRMARSKAESEAQAFIKDPGVYMRNSDPARAYRQAERDFKRSDFVRGLKSIHRQYDHFLRYPKYAIESSDLAKSDIGRELTALYKSPCGGVLITIAIYKFGGFISDFFLVMGVPENVLKVYGLGSGLNE